MSSRAEELIACLEAEIVKRDERIEMLEWHCAGWKDRCERRVADIQLLVERHASELAALKAKPDHSAQIRNMVPDGWMLVPVKPTIDMVEAGYEASLGQPDRSKHACVIEQYDAMLAAAPTANHTERNLDMVPSVQRKESNHG